LGVLAAVPVLGAAGFALAGRMAGGAAKGYVLKANLVAGHETPPVKNAPGATGLFKGTLTVRSGKGTLVWKLTFKGLTGPAFAAHVHVAPVGVSGPVAIPLCGPCHTGAHGSAAVKASVVKALLHKGAYANVHTKKHPNGEIRGQIRVTGTTTPKPSPTSTTPPSSTTYTY
jgi:hypothetical protein